MAAQQQLRRFALGALLASMGLFGVSGIIRGVLVGVSPLDPSTLGAVALGIGGRHGGVLPAGPSRAPPRPAQSLRQD